MHGVPIGSLFERVRDAQGRAFLIQSAGEDDALRRVA